MNTDGVLCLFLAFFSIQDLMEGRISRYATAAGLAAGLLFRRGEMAAGLFAGLAFFPLFLFRMMGAADVKVIAVITGFLGPERAVPALAMGFVLGAFWSLARLLHRRILWRRLSYFAAYIRRVTVTKNCEPYYRKERDGGEAAIPLAFCLSAGTAAYLLLEQAVR